MTRVAIECLKCGRHSSMGEDELRKFGEKLDAPIAKLVKRLTTALPKVKPNHALKTMALPICAA